MTSPLRLSSPSWPCIFTSPHCWSTVCVSRDLNLLADIPKLSFPSKWCYTTFLFSNLSVCHPNLSFSLSACLPACVCPSLPQMTADTWSAWQWSRIRTYRQSLQQTGCVGVWRQTFECWTSVCLSVFWLVHLSFDFLNSACDKSYIMFQLYFSCTCSMFNITHFTVFEGKHS